MNKKSIIVLLVLVLALSGLWGLDIVRVKVETNTDSTQITKMKNNGFAFNFTGEYDFNENWGVKANLGMMFAGKTSYNYKLSGENKEGPKSSEKRSGLYIDFALDAKYTYAINEKVSVAGLAGLELVSGHATKDNTPNLYYNVAFGLNIGAEGSYKITDKISVAGGVSGAWFFVNSAKAFKQAESTDDKVSVASFYIRPYVGATYSF